MALVPLQECTARTALSLPEAHTLALAGAAAMIAHGFVTRITKDIDLFTEVDDDALNAIVRFTPGDWAEELRCPEASGSSRS